MAELFVLREGLRRHWKLIPDYSGIGAHSLAVAAQWEMLRSKHAHSLSILAIGMRVEKVSDPVIRQSTDAIVRGTRSV